MAGAFDERQSGRHAGSSAERRAARFLGRDVPGGLQAALSQRHYEVQQVALLAFDALAEFGNLLAAVRPGSCGWCRATRRRRSVVNGCQGLGEFLVDRRHLFAHRLHVGFGLGSCLRGEGFEIEPGLGFECREPRILWRQACAALRVRATPTPNASPSPKAAARVRQTDESRLYCILHNVPKMFWQWKG